MAEKDKTVDVGRQLVVQAFRQAKESGKPDWYRMTTAVLKNRLLSLTNREFSEATYGASSLTDFVLRFSDILILDEAKFPIEVELNQEARSSVEIGSELSEHRNIRIKGELWRAIFDRSSGNTYYWLADLGIVGTSPSSGNCPILPTIDAETDRRWRLAFVESLQFASDGVKEWASSLLPLSKLPQDLRYQWNRTLTHNVHERLSNWFNEQEIDPPLDFVIEVEPRQDTRQENRPMELEALRGLVQRVIQEMSEQELYQLSLPTRAVLKATTPRKK